MVKYKEVARFIGELDLKYKITPKVEIQNTQNFLEQVIMIDYDFIKFRFNFIHCQQRCSLEWEERNDLVAILSNGKEITIHDYSSFQTAFEVAIEVAFELKSNTTSNKPMYLQILDVLKEFGSVYIKSVELVQETLYCAGNYLNTTNSFNFDIDKNNYFQIRLENGTKVYSLEELRVEINKIRSLSPTENCVVKL